MKLVTTTSEFEGQVSEVPVLISRDEPAPWGPEAVLRVVGHPATRIDGAARVTGAARYTADVLLPRMLHAQALRSPYPHARIVRIDTARAEQLPGVRLVLTHANTPRLRGQKDKPLLDQTLRFEGDEVAVVAADDPDICRDALDLIEVNYEPLPFVLDPRRALEPDAPRVFDKGNRATDPEIYERGDLAAGFRAADVVVERTYHNAPAVHNALEPHACVAMWAGDELTVWESTQGVQDTRVQVAEAFGLPLSRVQVICEFMGGGFGAKQSPGKYTFLAAEIARQTGRPVRMVLDRRAENLASGCRSEVIQTIKLGSRRDGTLTAIRMTAYGNAGAGGNGSGYCSPAKGLYQCPNVRTEENVAFTHTGPANAFRAPGTVEGTVALECAMDELAAALGLDPLELRRKNYAPKDQLLGQPYSGKALDEAYRIAAEKIGWDRHQLDRTKRRRGGAKRRGLGLATQYWGGGGGPPAEVLMKLDQDGSLEVLSGGQDIGTGTKTTYAQIAAEVVGVTLEAVAVHLGDSNGGPYAPTSGGSKSTPSVGPAVRMAAEEVRTKLVAAAAALLKCAPADVHVVNGEIWSDTKPTEHQTVAQIMQRLQSMVITGEGYRGPNPDETIIRTFGVQMAEVEVDVETGQVDVLRIVASHDVGRIINPLGAQSQLEGGIIQGLGYALTEGRLLDQRTGRSLNPNLEEYKVPTIADVPTIESRFVDRPDPTANTIGARGLGEPPIIPTTPAILNAIADATGVRVYTLPVTPARILDALRGDRARSVPPVGGTADGEEER